MRISARIKLDTGALLRSRGLGDSHEAQIALAETAVRLAEPYVPYDTGRLAESVEVSPDGDEIRYTAPYAAAQYYGRFREYQKNAGGLRGGHWMERMLADKQEELTDAVAKEVGGKRK